MSGLLRSILGLTVFIVGLTAGANEDENFVLPVGPNEIKIMSYNAENLFDAEHDRGKRDYEFLPRNHNQKENCGRSKACRDLDWTAEKVLWKYERIAEAIAGQGELPDILVLNEVENEAVVSGLAAHLGYEWFVMTNSPDRRGIDNAILFNEIKFKFLDYYELEVPGAMFETRNLSVLAVALNPELGGSVLTVFPNHFPSQLGKNSNQARMIVSSALRDFVDQMRAYYSQYEFHAVLTGDFNTLETENPHPIYDVLMSNWEFGMFDVRQYAIQQENPMIPAMPPGTYYYEREHTWNEFDRFIVDAGLADGRGLEVDAHSYRIHSPTYLRAIARDGTHMPYGYNHATNNYAETGYSDHFGIVMKLRYN